MTRTEELRAKVLNQVPCNPGEIHTFETETCRMAVLIENDRVKVVIRDGTPDIFHTEQGFSDFMEWHGLPRERK